MAEIKIEHKKRIWLWLLVGIAIVALLVYFLVFHNGGKNIETVTEAKSITNTNKPELVVKKEISSTVAAYISFVENSKGKMSLDHAYTNESLLKLTDAVNSLSKELGYLIIADLDKVKEYAKMITIDPYDTTHADNIRNAVDILTNVLHELQKSKYPNLTLEIEELKGAAESINPDVLTLNQKDAVKNYFAKASDLLKKMN